MRARFGEIAVLLDLTALEANLAAFELTLLRYKASPPVGPWAPHFQFMTVGIPSMLQDGLSQLPVLGDPAAPILFRLAAVLGASNGLVETELSKAFLKPGSDPLTHVDALTGFVQEVQKVQKVLERAVAQLEPIARPK